MRYFPIRNPARLVKKSSKTTFSINCNPMVDDRRRDWNGVLSTLSETIQFKSRADANNWRDAFENMQVYMQVSTGRIPRGR